ncbi:MAG: alpha-glucuronidase [Planctomycetes bacterium GWF2_41_51]|nr:MAG: alpha-glucuronidase [Planctomycetes bacterium GWF2_41_51]HBG27549.1 alpha-glucuronidase [Phycisphaerales bacterium]
MNLYGRMSILVFICLVLASPSFVQAKTNFSKIEKKKNMKIQNEDGYNLWLRYPKIDNPKLLDQYRSSIKSVCVLGGSKTFDIIRNEFDLALPAMLDKSIPITSDKPQDNSIIAATIATLKKFSPRTCGGGSEPRPSGSGNVFELSDIPNISSLGDEGFLIRSREQDGKKLIIITANSDIAVLTGTFHFLSLLQTHQSIENLNIKSIPKIKHRILSHWDNLDGSIERGYAGKSLWQWNQLPKKIDPRYYDYGRACASIGINGTILNNVNDQTQSLSSEYITKTAALADCLRPYGVKVFLTAVFSAPVQLGNLPTSDPRDAAVANWWKQKTDEIYRQIPDFGGFQVKASSEGAPGPHDEGANHNDGANMMADALHPHGGIILWRAFVYDTTIDSDRFKCAYKEFVPLDGSFKSDIFVQVKNGPIDFQPREPVNPLFGSMLKTPLALELQITQEYLGHANHLVYLSPMWKETLDWDTYANGPSSTVSKIIDGSLYKFEDSAIVAVTNTGSDRNWTGHHIAQANWFAFGRLAWNYRLSDDEICDQWVKMTFSNDPAFVEPVKKMMLGSWEACINYMTPLGLHHIMQEGFHYGPQPDLNTAPRPDWNSTYYHRADANGLGFDRTKTGSNAVAQYRSPLKEQFENIDTCPEKFLLWFHHVPWNRKMKSGRTLWQELEKHYADGVQYTAEMESTWKSLEGKIDPQRFKDVEEKLKIQHNDAKHWRDVCLKYFSQFVQK